MSDFKFTLANGDQTVVSLGSAPLSKEAWLERNRRHEQMTAPWHRGCEITARPPQAQVDQSRPSGPVKLDEAIKPPIPVQPKKHRNRRKARQQAGLLPCCE
jgi:hypothetical protein